MVDEDKLSSIDMLESADLLISSSIRGVGERLLSLCSDTFTVDFLTDFSRLVLIFELKSSDYSVCWIVETFCFLSFDSPS